VELPVLDKEGKWSRCMGMRVRGSDDSKHKARMRCLKEGKLMR
jgi:hypothetical protein